MTQHDLSTSYTVIIRSNLVRNASMSSFSVNPVSKILLHVEVWLSGVLDLLSQSENDPLPRFSEDPTLCPSSVLPVLQGLPLFELSLLLFVFHFFSDLWSAVLKVPCHPCPVPQLTICHLFAFAHLCSVQDIGLYNALILLSSKYLNSILDLGISCHRSIPTHYYQLCLSSTTEGLYKILV